MTRTKILYMFSIDSMHFSQLLSIHAWLNPCMWIPRIQNYPPPPNKALLDYLEIYERGITWPLHKQIPEKLNSLSRHLSILQDRNGRDSRDHWRTCFLPHRLSLANLH
jgi:hypothetical protein